MSLERYTSELQSAEKSGEGPGFNTGGIPRSALCSNITEQSSEGPGVKPGGIARSVEKTQKRGMKRKLETKTYEQKYEAIMEVERGQKSKKQIAADFNIPASTLSTWIRNSDEIKKKMESGEFGPQRKKDRQARFPQVEEALLKWFGNARAQNVPLSGEIMREKARDFARRFDIPDSAFEGSSGWLERFKLRHGIVFKRVCGEANSVVSNDAMVQWKSTLATLMKDYSADCVYNADETGIFYRMLPDKTMEFKAKPCHGGKQSKERLTVLVCANMSGSDKLPLLVIGKALKPRCFKNQKILPTAYTANKKAWMTSGLFTDWLKKVDRDMSRRSKSIVLVIDNCPAHPVVDGLKSVKLVFLPPNTTSVTQPMDQGVIHNLKTHYRKLVRQRQIMSIDKMEDFNISVLDAMRMMHQAWGSVTQQTIQNCFRHAGFSTTSTDADAADPNDDIPLSELAIMLGGIGMEEYVTADDNLPTCEDLTDDVIVDNVKSSRVLPTDESDDDKEDETPSDVNIEGAFKACEYLMTYFSTTDCREGYDRISKIQGNLNRLHLQRLCATQTDITRFFKPEEDNDRR